MSTPDMGEETVMTEPDTTEPTTEVNEQHERGDGDQEQQPAVGRDAAGEAKRYRQRAQQAEQQRDALQKRVDTADRADVLRLAAEYLRDPEDLLLVTPLDDLRGEDGAVDPQRVAQAAQAAAETRPHWRQTDPEAGRTRARGRERPTEAQQPAGPKSQRGEPTGRSWAEVLPSR